MCVGKKSMTKNIAKNTANKDELYKSLVTSLLVSVPSFCASLYFMEAKIVWDSPSLVVTFLLGFAVANFASIVILEHYRSEIGKLTLPALLSAVGLVFLFVIAEAINRFFLDFGYNWLFPVVLLALGLSFIAIFKEEKLALKCQLAFNSVAVAVLWALGVADKVAIPF